LNRPKLSDDGDFEGAVREETHSLVGAQAEHGPPLEVRRAVVLTESKRIGNECGDRVADAGLQRNLAFIAQTKIPLDARLPAVSARVPRPEQHAERQHRRDARVEDVELQPRGKPPVLVPQVTKGFDGQETIKLAGNIARVKVGGHQTAGLEPADLGSLEYCKQGTLAGERVESLRAGADGRSGGQEERRPGRDRPLTGINEVGRRGPANQHLDVRQEVENRQRLRGLLCLAGSKCSRDPPRPGRWRAAIDIGS
jgi:hypothetical protein